jgi:hypothetical protein
MEVKKLHDNIYYYKNVIENPSSILEMVENLEQYDEISTVITKWENDNDNRFKKDVFLDALLRNKEEAYVFMPNTPETVINDMETIIMTTQEALLFVANHFWKDKQLSSTPNISPALNMCKYPVNGNIGAHFDAENGDTHLSYTMLIYWNDNYKGGEISFAILDDDRKYPSNDITDPSIDIILKPEAGSIVIFPSTYPYIHQSHPVISGFKYITTSAIFVDGYDFYNEEHVKAYKKPRFNIKNRK